MKLKPSARLVELPDDPYNLVRGADFWPMAFESVNEATCLWIKDHEFTVMQLLAKILHLQKKSSDIPCTGNTI
jgi:phosphatidylserine decarboxylase